MRIRESVRRRIDVEQQRARDLGMVRRRIVQRAAIVDGHGAGRAVQEHGLVQIEIGIVLGAETADPFVIVIVAAEPDIGVAPAKVVPGDDETAIAIAGDRRVVMRLTVALGAVDALIGSVIVATLGAKRGEDPVAGAAAALVHPCGDNLVGGKTGQRDPGDAVSLVVLIALGKKLVQVFRRAEVESLV